MTRKALIAGGTVALLIVAFVAGAVAAPQLSGSIPGVSAASGDPAGGRGMGGPMANLSEEEQAQLEGMSAEERQAFLQEKFGDRAQSGGMRGPGQSVIEGEVLSVDSETLSVKTSDGGSQSVYLDSDTVIAYSSGADQAGPAQGDEVMVLAEPESDNVLAATAVIVR